MTQQMEPLPLQAAALAKSAPRVPALPLQYPVAPVGRRGAGGGGAVTRERKQAAADRTGTMATRLDLDITAPMVNTSPYGEVYVGRRSTRAALSPDL